MTALPQLCATLTLLLLAALATKHFVFDFVLQTPYQLRNKGIYGHPGGLLHAGLHAISTGAILAVFPVAWSFAAIAAVCEFVVHYHIDWAKEQVIARHIEGRGGTFWAVFGFDQLLHQYTYLVIVALV